MKKIILISFVICLSACSQFEPFEDMRREAGQIQTVGQSSNDQPAICYNPMWHDEEQIQKLAENACARTKRHAVLQQKKAFSCRFVNPSTAFYKCK